MSESGRERRTSPRRGRDDAAQPEGPARAGKGRATPKRSTAREAKKRPLVPADRRAAARASRAKQREERARARQAMLSGDERHLPLRDRGPVRRYVRNYVDARWNLGEFFLPASLVIVVVVLMTGNADSSPSASSPSKLNLVPLFAIFAMYLVVIAAVIDAVILGRVLKRRVREKFGEVPRGTAMYAAMRAFQMRRTRLPRPTVKRGQYPS